MRGYRGTVDRGAGLELRVREGRAVLTSLGDGAAEPGLPADLRDALHEWARVAEYLGTGSKDAVLVSRRGRQLAGRVAATTGRPVGYVDPLEGGVELIGSEPTPWGTGLTVSAATVALVMAALVSLADGLAEIAPWVAVVALLLATAGLAPSVWLGRDTPVWRWVAYGVAAGVALSWVMVVALLLR